MNVEIVGCFLEVVVADCAKVAADQAVVAIDPVAKVAVAEAVDQAVVAIDPVAKVAVAEVADQAAVAIDPVAKAAVAEAEAELVVAKLFWKLIVLVSLILKLGVRFCKLHFPKLVVHFSFLLSIHFSKFF